MNEAERPYDGCGKCLLGVRRLSRVKAATTSPERQREDVLTAAAAVGGHIIDWADDWEVSGATDPITRPKLGPWLRDERGKYDGLVAAAVDRLGRNVVDCLNTGYKMRDEGKLLVSYGHEGVWNLDDPNDENRFTMEAWGAQMELRAIQRRNRDATKKIRAAGRPKGKPSYGFRYVRTVPNGRFERVELHPHAAEVLRTVAGRIRADPENVSPSSEAARLNRLGEPAPVDHLAVMYGKVATGRPWYPTSLRNMLLSEAAMGYLVHQGKPVIDRAGKPVRLCEGLWNRTTHNALKEALRARDTPFRGRKSNRPYLPDGSGRVRPVPQPSLHPDIRRCPASLRLHCPEQGLEERAALPSGSQHARRQPGRPGRGVVPGEVRARRDHGDGLRLRQRRRRPHRRRRGRPAAAAQRPRGRPL
ncbi:recombinase family protein [Streptomyces sp. NPDC004266]|uniref:recombinase family protein n=1 Tax=Streptomyces sp. NPDC004266 TaxID=3364693 RepID=UPI003684BE0F